MVRIKRCPSCGFENPATEMMCQKCLSIIAEIEPVEETAPKNPDPGQPPPSGPAETVKMSTSIAFYTEDGSLAFSCSSGSIIGRQYSGESFLSDQKTVSRRHCRVVLTTKGWTIEDLGSVNGTYLNGERINGPTILTNNDRIQLSQACTLQVKI